MNIYNIDIQQLVSKLSLLAVMKLVGITHLSAVIVKRKYNSYLKVHECTLNW